MSIKRYNKLIPIEGGLRYGTSYIIPIIRDGIKNGNIRVVATVVLQERQRLDTIAGQVYGDSDLAWVLAAASNIGFWLQCPPGTLVRVPDLEDVLKYLD